MATKIYVAVETGFGNSFLNIEGVYLTYEEAERAVASSPVGGVEVEKIDATLKLYIVCRWDNFSSSVSSKNAVLAIMSTAEGANAMVSELNASRPSRSSLSYGFETMELDDMGWDVTQDQINF